ncbi:MAG: hypothetical protein ACREEX_15810, partial [Caulobacteraceae bacterium]
VEPDPRGRFQLNALVFHPAPPRRPARAGSAHPRSLLVAVRTYGKRHRLSSPFPFLPIDQVYAGDSWKTVSVKLGPRLGSDHLPVVVVLTRNDRQGSA